MRICRFDDDRLGVVSNSLVHDVTVMQEQIRAATPYAAKGDADKAIVDFARALHLKADHPYAKEMIDYIGNHRKAN